MPEYLCGGVSVCVCVCVFVCVYVCVCMLKDSIDVWGYVDVCVLEG